MPLRYKELWLSLKFTVKVIPKHNLIMPNINSKLNIQHKNKTKKISVFLFPFHRSLLSATSASKSYDWSTQPGVKKLITHVVSGKQTEHLVAARTRSFGCCSAEMGWAQIAVHLVKAQGKHLEMTLLEGWGNTAGSPDMREFASNSVAELDPDLWEPWNNECKKLVCGLGWENSNKLHSLT